MTQVTGLTSPHYERAINQTHMHTQTHTHLPSLSKSIIVYTTMTHVSVFLSVILCGNALLR